MKFILGVKENMTEYFSPEGEVFSRIGQDYRAGAARSEPFHAAQPVRPQSGRAHCRH